MSDLVDSSASVSSISNRRSLDDYMVVAGPGKKSDLGSGAFGRVKLVVEKKSGKHFAMKIMEKKQIFQYCSVENLKREIKIQKKACFPNICKLYHYFEDKDQVYLILDYAENGSLFNYL
jgi:serine/threonine protein kinase